MTKSSTRIKGGKVSKRSPRKVLLQTASLAAGTPDKHLPPKSITQPADKRKKGQKEYEVVIHYIEWENGASMETRVNGETSPMPTRLKNWIARDLINQLLSRHKEYD